MLHTLSLPVLFFALVVPIQAGWIHDLAPRQSPAACAGVDACPLYWGDGSSYYVPGLSYESDDTFTCTYVAEPEGYYYFHCTYSKVRVQLHRSKAEPLTSMDRPMAQVWGMDASNARLPTTRSGHTQPPQYLLTRNTRRSQPQPGSGRLSGMLDIARLHEINVSTYLDYDLLAKD